MAERQDFSFNVGELDNIASTEEIIDAGENFLNSDLEGVSLVKQKQKEKQPKQEEEEEVEEGKASKKKTAPIKEVVTPPKELKDDELFGSLSDEEEEEEEEEVEEVVAKKKKNPVTNQELQEEKEEGQEAEPEGEEANMFSVLAKDLVDHGIFTLDDDEEEVEVETPEDLLARFQYESRKQVQQTLQKYIGRFGEDYQDMFNSVYVNGVSPRDYLSRYAKIVDVSEMDIEDDANQEKIVREMYRMEGRSSEYIEKQVSRLRSYGDLGEEAKEAKRILIERQQSELENLEIKKAEDLRRKQAIKQEFFENISTVLNDKIKTKDFDGIPVNANFARSTFDYLTKDRYQTKGGELLTEFDKDILDLNRPDKHDVKVKLAMLMLLLKEDPKLSKLAARAVSKETNELFKGIKQKAGKTTPEKKTTVQDKPKSWFENNNA